ncbi:hypothetical protein [Mycobacteroides abscessus]|uniref:hypothetical protein n=1 Tax=Mycobacteroides abscessus TaxID=36809 RepID=UPI0009280729|nr:hypothetical protein [Mycobacteroides abscessus]MCU8692620.1 hypothetical protein [Mycobacteroides abscessus]MCU8711829.1 hypothetical protein [Mycobacteroides abscessus]MCU8716575.1 hypothetical protein [Mycobacteroides abscessus]MCU8750590.1 hypothetical protein [Mycobacteroides abscessus]MCU8761277.1 hypothetical protein [Mycobacteroides abscessus]
MDTGFGTQELYSACRLQTTHHFVDGGSHCTDLKGTGFLVEFPTGDNRIGLVTNRHLADAVFHNDVDNHGSVVTSIKLQWWQSKDLRCELTINNPMPFYHSDPLIDVAIIPVVAKSKQKLQATGEYYGDDINKFMTENAYPNLTFNHAISWEMLQESEKLWPQLQPGEFVVFPGYPVWHDKLQIRPVMRSGLLASDPQTDYRSEEGKPTKDDSSHQVLFDAFSTSGNSGSPVFVAQRGIPPSDLLIPIGDGMANHIQIGSPNYHRSFLIGINASHYNETGIPQHNEHAGLSRMHKLSAIMDILRDNHAPHDIEVRGIRLVIPVPDGS